MSRRRGVPVGQRFYIIFGSAFAVAVAEDGFEHESDADGQSADRADAGFFQGGERVVGVARAAGEGESLEGSVEVMQGRAHSGADDREGNDSCKFRFRL